MRSLRVGAITLALSLPACASLGSSTGSSGTPIPSPLQETSHSLAAQPPGELNGGSRSQDDQPGEAASLRCPARSLLGVYVPFRLFVLDTCAWYRGRVTRTRAEDDGDTHVLIRPDAGFGRFLNAGNVRDQHGWLVVEIMPGQRLPVPDIGAHVAVFGTWVLDAAHGWREIHPVWAIRFLDRGITRYDLPPRKPRYDPDTGEASGPSGGRGGCDLSYPTVCIPPPPPDRDCADVPYRDFKVVGDDPHGFDTDGDGVGCET